MRVTQGIYKRRLGDRCGEQIGEIEVELDGNHRLVDRLPVIQAVGTIAATLSLDNLKHYGGEKCQWMGNMPDGTVWTIFTDTHPDLPENGEPNYYCGKYVPGEWDWGYERSIYE